MMDPSLIYSLFLTNDKIKKMKKGIDYGKHTTNIWARTIEKLKMPNDTEVCHICGSGSERMLPLYHCDRCGQVVCFYHRAGVKCRCEPNISVLCAVCIGDMMDNGGCCPNCGLKILETFEELSSESHEFFHRVRQIWERRRDEELAHSLGVL